MPLTTQEHSEIVKLVNGHLLLSSSLKKVAKVILDHKDIAFTDAERTQITFIHSELVRGIIKSGQAFGYFLQVANNLDGFRNKNFIYPKNLDFAKSELADGLNSLATAQSRMTGAQFATALVDLTNGIASIKSMDTSLPFANPLPASYPRIIGPHGHYDNAQNAAFLAFEYFDESFGAIYASISPSLNPVWPLEANAVLGRAMDAYSDLFNRWMHGTALTSAVETDEDAATISSDNAHGSGLRPREFFRQLLSHEYFMNNQSFSPPLAFANRNPKPGVNGSLRAMLNEANQLLGILLPVSQPFVLGQLTGGGALNSDISVMWSATDTWSFSNLGFFFEIPAPPFVVDPSNPPAPSVVPVGEFDSEVTKLSATEAGLTPLSLPVLDEIRQSLRAREGKPL